MKKLLLYILISITLFFSCTSTQLNSVVKTVSGTWDGTANNELTTAQVVSGLKEALIKGAEYSSATASRTDGYFKNPELKIPFPPEIEKVETKLRQIGLNKPVDDFVLSMNRAAEKAAAEATPIFVTAIKSMTIQDAWGILKGDNDAATQYLKRTTGDQLRAKFEPIIEDALQKVNATKYYTDVTSTYNKIPFVEPVETNLTAYVNNLAIDGLFKLVAEEELKIRKDPIARTTDLLKKVFGYQE